MLPRHLTTRDHHPVPGVTLVDGGAEVCVYAGNAEAVEVCLFDEGDQAGESERRVQLTERLYGHWFGHVPGMGVGQRYGLRAHGPWSPQDGLRYNPHKLLLDPYARSIEGDVRWVPEVFGHVAGPDLRPEDLHRMDERDSAAYLPRNVVVRDAFDWGGDRPLRQPLTDSIIYETHVRSLTKRLPGVPEPLRGTYAGLAHPATIEHLLRVGVTAVELLPVHAFTTEPEVYRRGLVNYWGYNTLGFFAPHARYAASRSPQGVLDEFKGMVKLLHEAGLEVILDVVYNHTAEQSARGATLSWRGLDNRAYYRLDGRGDDIDVTGCGNTVDVRHIVATRMILDSMRYWVTECHVDGFRFDLAVALGRGRNDEFDPDHPLLVALRTDPVLSQVKNIAEPWDLGIQGWRTGQFPPPFSEWNDRFRDRVRSFWLTDIARVLTGQGAHGVQDLATRLSGSADHFHHLDRGPSASINFVAAHDGFTSADLTAYNHKHNDANREDNRDGSDNNSSWNHGIEGWIDDGVAMLRHRSMRNLMGTLLVATGVPMINGGDELGRTQHGNNNAFCHDNELTWYDWQLQPWQEDLLATTAFLTRLRHDFPVLRQRRFFSGGQVHLDGSKDLEWFDAAGSPMTMSQWADDRQRTLQMYLNGGTEGHTSLLVVLHGGAHDVEVQLPQPPGLTGYELLWDSAWDRPPEVATAVDLDEPAVLLPASMRIYRAIDPT
ncbi:MAG TPA: glycogen debranching protein GlgX [Dermatophilaceae bacterium]|nr:glycogen debranching protein GlgX [Dermatophilaceae bacterium]